MFEVETGLIFWNTVSFAILVVLMYNWVLPPLLKILKERQETIQRSIDGAAESHKKAEEALSSVKHKLAEANQTAQRIVDQAKGEGDKLKEEMVVAARRESELLSVRAKEDLRREKDGILSEIEKHTAELVAAAAGRVLHKKIDQAENKRLIEESIKECRA